MKIMAERRTNSGTETLHLCCFEDDTISRLKLDRIDRKHASLPKSCWELEDFLERFLGDENVPSNSEDLEPMPPLRYNVRPDISWLSCRKPTVAVRETILGLLEEDLAQPRDVPIEMNAWIASEETKEKFGCSCTAPHHSWDRVPLTHTAMPPPLPTASESSPPAKINPKLPNWKVDWVDFRSVPVMRLTTPAALTHFLRSLLGSSLDASPWINSEDSAATPGTSLGPSDCAILVFPSKAPDELVDFRVSDACPSWSLYSIASMQLPGGERTIFPWDCNEESSANDLVSAEVLIYRKLPIRDKLSSLHPHSNEKALDGCLWQTKLLYPDSEEGCEAKGDPYYDYRMVASPYINPIAEFSELSALTTPDNLAVIRREARKIPQWTAWPEQQHYRTKNVGSDDDDDGAPWHVFPLCYCFPADDVKKRRWIPLTSGFVPETVALLKKYLGDSLRTALFSRLDPGAVLEAHTGWEDLANFVYRVHLPLEVPKGGLCGTWVDGCVETHETGRLQAFDDSKTHRAFNYSSEDRVVLILDLARPSALPLGTATGGHTDELDKFVEQMGGSL